MMNSNRSLAALVVCAVSFTALSKARAAEPAEPSAIVKKLYAAHTDESQLFKQTKDRAVLDPFFRKDLADLIWKDAVDAKGELGALDFDPLYYSQDPQITEFKIADTSWGRDKKFGSDDEAFVEVDFKDGGEEKTMLYEFDRDRKTKEWRIHDVQYPDGNMLVKILKGESDEAGEGGAEEAAVDYKPGGAKWAEVWQAFYNNPGAEEDLMTPLVMAGPKMVPVILEAIAHKDMRQRRYAIGALGNLNDASATDPLSAIVNDTKEEDYFRGDALSSLYKLDPGAANELAKKYADEGDNLKDTATSILKEEPWLLAGMTAEAPEGKPSDGEAYVIDKDPDGLNVRSNPRTGAVIGNLPMIEKPDGLSVHIVGEDPETGWILIDRAETYLGETPYGGLGWVSGNMLAVFTRNPDGKTVNLYDTASGKGKVIATVPAKTEVRIAGSRGKALLVKYKDSKGWLMPESQCANNTGNCD